MIYDKLENAKQYQFNSPSLMAAMHDLLQLNMSADDKAPFRKLLNKFSTSQKSEKKAEFHKQHIDIHVVLDGTEYVEVGHIDTLTITDEYSETNDIGFGYLDQSSKFTGYLRPGYFLLCFPWDAHLVGAHEVEQSEVTKVVYKIKVDNIQIYKQGCE